MNPTFLGCWIGAGLVLVHLLTGRLLCKHWPEPLSLAGMFLTGLGVVVVCGGLWPVLTDTTVVDSQVTMTSELFTSLWLGLLGTLGVAGVAIHKTATTLLEKRRQPPPKP